MLQKLPLKTLLILLLVAVAIPSIAEARRHGHRHFFWWWFRPPVDPVVDMTEFDPVEVEHSKLYCYLVADGSLQEFTRKDYLDAVTTASVQDDQIAVATIATATEDGLCSVSVEIDPATLIENVFGSKFYANGTATIVDTESGDQNDLTVLVLGRIYQTDGEYRLRGKVRGFTAIEDEEAGTTEYKFVRLSFSGTAPIPTEEEPEEPEEPVEEPAVE